MNATDIGEKSGRGRPRSLESRERILAATQALLQTTRWSELTVEAIAKEAKVGKQTIYRWWGGRPGVVVDAYLSSLQSRTTYPDTKDLRRDLITYLDRISEALRETNASRTLAVIVAELQYDEALAEEFRERFLAVRRNGLRIMVERGIARGEVREDLDVELLLDMLFGAFWYRMLVGTRPIDGKFIRGLVAQMWPSIEARPHEEP